MKNDILGKIVANKLRELIIRKKIQPLKQLTQNLKASNKSFYKALSNKQSDFIFECKKASPSRGLINPTFDLDKILAIYKNYASVISVLTDNKYFKGSFAHLRKVTDSVKQPVICKDFFIDSYQIYEARYYGADAILLMLSVLSDQEYLELAETANQLNMGILTEVHDSNEMQRAIKLKAKIVGINNRNLKDLSIDLRITEKLIAEVPKDIKDNTLFISESGIESHQQIQRLSPLVNGFLIGSSIMATKDTVQQCKSLIYGNIKICGLTEPDAAIAAEKYGATYGGLIFYRNSPRFVNKEQAKEITDSIKLKYVGVFVDESLNTIVETANYLNINIIQLHGEENLDYIEQLKRLLPNCKIWKAIKVEENLSLTQLSMLKSPLIHKFVLDTYNKEKVGGSGQSFDWQILGGLNKEKIILAGGLKKNNILEAQRLNTFALDINSGVEISPGKKPSEKIKQIFQLLHA